jgi:hypothetical protein
MSRFDLCAALLAVIGACPAGALAQTVVDANGRATQGSLQISGGPVGCVSLVKQRFNFAFDGTYPVTPRFNASGSAAEEHDWVEIHEVLSVANHAEVVATTHGRHENHVCGRAFINWTIAPGG